MLRLIIFDWNGTLLDDFEHHFQSVVAIFRHYQVSPPTREDVRRELTADFMPFYWGHGIPRTATAEDLNKIRIKSLQAVGMDNYRLAEGTREVIQHLSGCTPLHLAIVSAGNSEVVPNQIEHLGIKIFFPLVITDAYGGKKVEALREALSRFKYGLKPRQAVYVDDMYDGIMAARAVGLWTIGASWKSAYHSRA